MKKKKTKIKWGNVLKAVVFLFSAYMILHDLYMISIYPIISGNYCGLTGFGLLVLITNFMIVGFICEDFEEQIEKTSTTRNS